MALSLITAAQRYLKIRGGSPTDRLPALAVDVNPIITLVNDLTDGSTTQSSITPSTGTLVITGAETVSSTLGVTGVTTATGGLSTDTITPVTSGAGTAIKRRVGVVSGSTLTSATTPAISAATSGTDYTFAAAAITVTLPACGTATIGTTYRFITTTIATAQIINTTGSDVFLGSVYSTLAVVNATNDTACGSSTANKTMTMNGTTTGGLPGSCITVTCISATQWLVNGFVIGASGTQTTLFSN